MMPVMIRVRMKMKLVLTKMVAFYQTKKKEKQEKRGKD